MFDELNEQASQAIEYMQSFGAYNIRFKAYIRFVIDVIRNTADDRVLLSLIADHPNDRVFDDVPMVHSGVRAEVKKTRVKVGERPVHLKYGEGLDLIEDDSVVYVVVQTEHEANLSSILVAHPEWAGRVQVVVLTLTKTIYWDEVGYTATFKVHGAGAPKEGTFSNEERAYFEFVGRSFYIHNHKVVWKGKIADRDVATDINSLLAGSNLVVRTESVPPPLHEDVLRSQLMQVSRLIDGLTKGKDRFKGIRPALEWIGCKIYSQTSPPVAKFKCKLYGSPNQEVAEEVEVYFTLLEAVREIFPYVQTELTSP
jgi:hypothetical protein